MARLRILLVSRSGVIAKQIEDQLRDHPRYKLATKIVTNGHVDPLADVSSVPDVLLLHCITGYGELQHLADTRSANSLPLIVLGPANNSDAMRLSMRAGASDYLASPLDMSELLAALDRVAAQIQTEKNQAGQLVTVVNSHGGSGASFIAANLAYGLHGLQDINSLLIDFDLQFGGLSRYFDLNPKHGIIEALEAVEEMDEVSAESYISQHESGMRLLAACTDTLMISNEVSVERVDALLRMFLKHNDYVVVDLPRHIDLLGATVLESSHKVLLVVQQSLSHLHDATRMFRLIVNELGVPSDRVSVVVNRYNKKLLIDSNDICQALKIEDVIEIPNHYGLVSESIDTGKPILDKAKSTGVGRALAELQAGICGIESTMESQSILERAIPSLLRRTQ